MSEPDLSLDKSLLMKMRQQNEALQRYEGKIQALLQEHIDGTINQEEWQEAQDELRSCFLTDFQEITSKVDITAPEITFRNIVYENSLKRVKRYFGYYKAITDVKKAVIQYNMELNEEVLQVETKDELQAINKLENVKFVLEMATALALPKPVIERIMSNTIDEVFRSKKP